MSKTPGNKAGILFANNIFTNKVFVNSNRSLKFAKNCIQKMNLLYSAYVLNDFDEGKSLLCLMKFDCVQNCWLSSSFFNGNLCIVFFYSVQIFPHKQTKEGKH